ncbi:MAG TPA: YgjP-like metallopeptidase domain-containing protein [Patescibacteria group bacterium]|nr:YgjP-like metallopeptidase domain-containing protein [Patescibacteria group bacterium]
MAFRQFELENGLSIKIYKRKGSRSLRLSVSPTGTVRVSMPPWAPYSAGLSFAQTRYLWIQKQMPASPGILAHGQPIGKAHHLVFAAKAGLTRPSTRLVGSEVTVSHPPELSHSDHKVQLAAATASVRALKLQAEQLLPGRLQALATQHGFAFKSLKIKRLKSRWGSCDQQKNIVLNLYLMQLPWEYIDYVLLHELAHTKVLRHGSPFWSELEKLLPEAKTLRRNMRAWQPVLMTNSVRT